MPKTEVETLTQIREKHQKPICLRELKLLRINGKQRNTVTKNSGEFFRNGIRKKIVDLYNNKIEKYKDRY